MLNSVFRRPSPALAISSVALFLALGGGAFAAASSDNAKDKRIATRVVRHLAPSLSVAHASSADSATNASHASSADSAGNASKLGGSPASSYVQYGTLPGGHTETGMFGIRLSVAAAGVDQPDDPISFPIPLASAPTLGGAADCTGSPTNPTAAPGKLCLYPFQSNDVGTVFVTGDGSTVGATPFGTILWVRSAAAGDKIYRGVWAVTAP